MDTSTVLGLTYVTVAIIAVLTIYALLTSRARVVSFAPSLLTSIGIFGTFLGITVGLAGFDPDNVTSSVPKLFGGIKLAFWTSVAGILGGILVRFRILFSGIPERGTKPATADDVVEGLDSLREVLVDTKASPLLRSLRELQESTAEHSADQVKEMSAAIHALQ
ncbi:MAG: hypothetical protein ABF296_03470, partial [Oceanococcaceae bacterium]